MLAAFKAVVLSPSLDTWSEDTRCDRSILVGGRMCRLLGKEVGGWRIGM
jgi:hypothetical protein